MENNGCSEGQLPTSVYWMIDIETTGYEVDGNDITSIAGIAFDARAIKHGLMRGYDSFALRVPKVPWRHADVEILRWREEHGVPQAEKALPLPSSVEELLNIIDTDFINRPGLLTIGVMAKPAHFDFAFLGSYYREHGRKEPWRYRQVRDLASVVDTLGYNLHDQIEAEVRKTWLHDPHVALNDCLFQIECLRLAYVWHASRVDGKVVPQQ